MAVPQKGVRHTSRHEGAVPANDRHPLTFPKTAATKVNLFSQGHPVGIFGPSKIAIVPSVQRGSQTTAETKVALPSALGTLRHARTIT